MLRSISASASSVLRPGRYGRSLVIASKLSATTRKCAASGWSADRDSVVAAPVVALAVVLDGAGLGGGDLEPAQQAGREARRAPDRVPFVRPQLAGLAQHGRVDRDLAEIVQARRPAQAVDVGVGQAERAGERVDVAGDADRVAVGRGVALVDDVREGLEGVERLLPGASHARVGLVNGQRDRDDRDHVPRVAEGEEGQDRAEARLGGGGGEVGLQHLEPADHLKQQARDEQVDERQHGQGTRSSGSASCPTSPPPSAKA